MRSALDVAIVDGTPDAPTQQLVAAAPAQSAMTASSPPSQPSITFSRQEHQTSEQNTENQQVNVQNNQLNVLQQQAITNIVHDPLAHEQVSALQQQVLQLTEQLRYVELNAQAAMHQSNFASERLRADLSQHALEAESAAHTRTEPFEAAARQLDERRQRDLEVAQQLAAEQTAENAFREQAAENALLRHNLNGAEQHNRLLETSIASASSAARAPVPSTPNTQFMTPAPSTIRAVESPLPPQTPLSLASPPQPAAQALDLSSLGAMLSNAVQQAVSAALTGGTQQGPWSGAAPPAKAAAYAAVHAEPPGPPDDDEEWDEDDQDEEDEEEEEEEEEDDEDPPPPLADGDDDDFTEDLVYKERALEGLSCPDLPNDLQSAKSWRTSWLV
jgi:hypothetical protein